MIALDEKAVFETAQTQRQKIARIGKRIDIRRQKLYNIFTNLSAVGENEVCDG